MKEETEEIRNSWKFKFIVVATQNILDTIFHQLLVSVSKKSFENFCEKDKNSVEKSGNSNRHCKWKKAPEKVEQCLFTEFFLFSILFFYQ